MLRFVLGAFLLCGILLPVGKGLPDLEFDVQASASVSQDEQQFKDAVDRQFYEAARNGISSVVAGELYKMGIKCENVDLMMDTNEDSSKMCIRDRGKGFLQRFQKDVLCFSGGGRGQQADKSPAAWHSSDQ